MRENSSDSIYIVKLGGSLITNKNEPFSLRKKIIRNAVSEIVESGKKTIIIHGGGSFGHPIAKKYNIISGLDNSIENQIFGLAQTHNVMTKLNNKVLEEFLHREISAISIDPSSIFIKDPKKGIDFNPEVVKLTLDLGIIPILYGDIILSRDGNFSILSGDTIILKLCENLEEFEISKVIFAMEIDGLYVKDSETNEIKLATTISHEQIESIALANLKGKIDITGGIRKKLENIKKIIDLGIPVQLISGLKENNIKNALNGKKVKATYFKPSEL